MRLLLFSDLHLDAPFKWAGPVLARKRRQSLRDALRQIASVAAEVRVDALVCGGDLYEQECYSPDTGELLRRTFAELSPIPVYIAPGNHDWFGPASLYRRFPWTPNVHIFERDHLTPVTLADGLTLWGASHRAPANTDGFLEGFFVDRGGVHLALFHGSERHLLVFQESGKAPHAPFDAADLERSGIHHAFLGHYHNPRDEARYTYPGNPEPLSFGETGERGVVIATINEDGSVVREHRRVATTEISELDVSVTGCSSEQDVRDRVAAARRAAPGLLRVTLQGELGPDVDVRPQDLSDPTSGLIVRAGSIRVAYDLEVIKQEQTVRGQFVRDVLDSSDLSKEERQRVIVIGLRALEGRSDFEVA
jgi:DNA repair exonuclease SbcCD nuclease subunit